MSSEIFGWVEVVVAIVSAAAALGVGKVLGWFAQDRASSAAERVSKAAADLASGMAERIARLESEAAERQRSEDALRTELHQMRQELNVVKFDLERERKMRQSAEGEIAGLRAQLRIIRMQSDGALLSELNKLHDGGE